MFISDLQSKLKMGLGIPIWLKDNLSPSPKSKKKCDERPSSRQTILASAGVSTMNVRIGTLLGLYARALLHKSHEIASAPAISLPLINIGNPVFNKILPERGGIGTANTRRIGHYSGVAGQSLNRINDFPLSLNGDLT
ncbi:hypothetical protein [Phyllobacterium chamaecytisi]|uniref:hypothetical protein n=1 Tax=Phyllobacterium chamaecytisi TaxID=2876082 RepID=UPI001CCB6539|nr:hypothetical protein [Phyllobacterium sp. KW56]MBZ9600556.1 hypothetical protein [Phyllobacterium sp. KW56]